MKRILVLSLIVFLNGCSIFEEDSDDGLPSGWSKIDELRGGLVTSFFTDDDGLYVGTHANGVQFSDFSFDNWEEINNGINYYDQYGMPTLMRRTINKFIKKDEDIFIGVYATSGDDVNEEKYSGGLFKLNDSKDTWEYIGYKELNIVDIGITENSFVVCTGDSVYKLVENDGERDKEVISAIEMHGARSLVIFENQIIISNRNGVYISDDLGDSWQYSQIGNEFSSIHVIKRVLNNLIVGTNNGIYISEDYGNTWIQNNNGIPYEETTDYANIYNITVNNKTIVALYDHYTYYFDGYYDDVQHRISTGIIYKNIDDAKWKTVEFQGKSGKKLGYPIYPYALEIAGDHILVSINKSPSNENNEVWINSKILKDLN